MLRLRVAAVPPLRFLAAPERTLSSGKGRVMPGSPGHGPHGSFRRDARLRRDGSPRANAARRIRSRPWTARWSCPDGIRATSPLVADSTGISGGNHRALQPYGIAMRSIAVASNRTRAFGRLVRHYIPCGGGRGYVGRYDERDSRKSARRSGHRRWRLRPAPAGRRGDRPAVANPPGRRPRSGVPPLAEVPPRLA